MRSSKTSAKCLPSAERLAECFTYNPETGELVRKLRKREDYKTDAAYKMSQKRFENYSGQRANSQGYLCAHVDGRSLLVHRIAWKISYGSEPEFIDHQNGDRKDNRLSNLRNVSKGQNAMNRAIQRNSSTGVHGVTICNRYKNFYVYIKKGGKRSFLGSTADFFEACCWRKSAEITFGFHENHGRARRVVTTGESDG
jgi:hypothetical protein